MYERILNLSNIIDKKSLFLLGPRQTGKSTLIRQQLTGALVFNLLESATYRSLGADPGMIRRELLAMEQPPKAVVIDEIQLLPELLNEVHLLIEDTKTKFLLTGSSSRALKRKGVNLLGGRARMQYLHPFVSAELGDDFDLERALNHGLLPAVYFSDEPNRDLADYTGMYLKEEIAAEGLTRNIPAFSRFLEVAALCNGAIINATKIASDAEVRRTTVIDWFQVLKDTLIATELPAFTKSKKRKAVASSKFYFFDGGVARYLTGQTQVERANPWYGVALETLVHHELRSFVDYGRGTSLEYWRTVSGFEVDFYLDRKVAIVVKASTKVDKSDFKGLHAISEEVRDQRLILVYLGEKSQRWENIEVIPLRQFLTDLWDGKINS